jgi:hypothetical protein
MGPDPRAAGVGKSPWGGLCGAVCGDLAMPAPAPASPKAVDPADSMVSSHPFRSFPPSKMATPAGFEPWLSGWKRLG